MEQMNIDVPPPPAYSVDPSKITYAEVATKMGKSIEHDTALSVEHDTALSDALRAFRNFLSSQENVRLSKNSLQVLKNQSVLVLEAVPGYIKSGGDASAILAAVSSIFNAASQELQDKEQWETVLQDPSGAKNLENIIGSAFENLEKQLEKIQGRQEESTMYRDELLKAQETDRHKIAKLEQIIEQITRPGETLKTRVEMSMVESLKIIGDPTVVHQQIDAKRSLAILAELTGKSLPPSTLLGKEFVTIGSHAIHQGSSYDIFEGEYFTGEKIAIKVLRHRVDEATAERMHQRFARQALNWSALRHDAILPFYGVGVTPSPVADDEFQLYMVSPYLQNQDVRKYLKKYPAASNATRVQIVLDVARGLNHMHVGADLPEPGNGIVHSALNIFNVLIKDSGRAVISGFGHSKVIKDFQESFTGDNSEYRYMGPELMLDDPHLTHGTDMWAWAMTALEILTDVPAFGEKTKGPRIIQMVALGKRPSRKDHPKLEKYASPDELWSLFEECWDQEPGNRPSAEDAVGRLKPILTGLGKRTDPVKQGQDSQPTGREPIPSHLGRADPPVQSGNPPPVTQDELGRGAPPAVQSEPPPQMPAKTGNQLGKSDPANVQAPNPPKP